MGPRPPGPPDAPTPGPAGSPRPRTPAPARVPRASPWKSPVSATTVVNCLSWSSALSILCRFTGEPDMAKQKPSAAAHNAPGAPPRQPIRERHGKAGPTALPPQGDAPPRRRGPAHSHAQFRDASNQGTAAGIALSHRSPASLGRCPLLVTSCAPPGAMRPERCPPKNALPERCAPRAARPLSDATASAPSNALPRAMRP